MAKPTGDARCPSPDALWQEAVRGVVLLPRRRPPALPPAAPAVASVKSASPQRQRSEDDRSSGIDRRTAQRLQRGLRRIEARLDLHGMTQREAHRALGEFVRASGAAGRRCLLIVTGRGIGAEGPGVLKTAVPRWLDEGELRRQILAVAQAQPRDGGAGALYVLLRRRR